MKNIGYIVLLLFVLPLTGLAQNDSIVLLEKEQPTLNNQVDLDVQYLGFNFLYKHKLNKKLFIGSGVGLGSIVSFALSSNETFADFARVQLLFDYHFNKNFHVYQGSTVSFFSYISSNDSFLATLRVGIGIFYKISRIELGIEPSIVLTVHDSSVPVTSLIILKIPLKRW